MVLVRELVFGGRVVSGVEALDLGLATRVSDDPLKEARELARRIAAHNPEAVRAGKRLLNAAAPVDAGRVLMVESLEQQRLLGSSNQIEALRAATENRTPEFR